MRYRWFHGTPHSVLNRRRKLAHAIGALLALIGAAFVLQQLWTYGEELSAYSLSAAQWLAILGFSLIYGTSNLMLAFAWRDLLAHVGIRCSRAWAVRIFGITQIAKYLPGNIFHLAGRQALGLAEGLPGWTLARSQVWELALLAGTATLFILLLLPTPVAGVLSFFVAALIAVLAIRRYLGSRVALAFLWHGLFFAVSGLIFLALIILVSQGSPAVPATAIPLVIGSFVVAWLGGLITPGAPAGAGIRELVLLLLLAPVFPEALLLMVVLLSRLTTVLGDVFFLAYAQTRIHLAHSQQARPTTSPPP